MRATVSKAEPVEEILPDVKSKAAVKDKTDKPSAKEKPAAEPIAKTTGKKPVAEEKPESKPAAKTPDKAARAKE